MNRKKLRTLCERVLKVDGYMRMEGLPKDVAKGCLALLDELDNMRKAMKEAPERSET